MMHTPTLFLLKRNTLNVRAITQGLVKETQTDMIMFLWTNPGIFLSIFVPFNNNFNRKILDFIGIRNWNRQSIRWACWPLDHNHLINIGYRL